MFLTSLDPNNEESKLVSCDNSKLKFQRKRRFVVENKNVPPCSNSRQSDLTNSNLQSSQIVSSPNMLRTLKFLGHMLPSRRTQSLWSKMNSFVIFMVLLCPLEISCSLEISTLIVPPYPTTGESVVLECHVNLQGDTLYSVLWYKDTKQFFKYSPSEAKNQMTLYDVPGVIVDRGMSTASRVRLKAVTIDSSGKYQCEVSADAPSFHTTAKEAEMLVVALPEESPKLIGGRSKYHIGDEVYVNCTSGKSHPPASLVWKINDEQARMNQLVEHAPIYDKDGLATSKLGLRFVAGLKHFPNGILKLKCSATVAAVYFQSSEADVEGHPSQSGPALESKGVYTDSSLSTFPNILMWHVLLLLTIILNCG